MNAHELAKQLLEGQDFPISASIDISTNDDDSDRRIFTNEFFGINDANGHGGEIVLLFLADPVDNDGNAI